MKQIECKCNSCGRQYVFVLKSENELKDVKCPSCGAKGLVRVGPGGFSIFGGMGGGGG